MSINMLKQLILLMLLLCGVTTMTYAQEFQVRNIKFKQGLVEQGMEIGMKYFHSAQLAANIKTKVYQYHSGPWDAQILIPILPNSKVSEVVFGYGNNSGAVWQEMLKIGGSEDKVVSDLKVYQDCILEEEISYAKRVEVKK